MNEIIHPGAGLLFMKVGTHAQESLEDIIARKSEEIAKEGFGLWGYGGNTCHPSTMVQPFAEQFAAQGQPIHLVMEEMNSKHFAEPLCAKQYSADNLNWQEIPEDIQVRGSRFALKIGNLRKVDYELPLNGTRIAVGPTMGRLGGRYVQGRVDKACLRVLDQPEIVNEEDERSIRPINLVADLVAPYAVFLRGFR